MSNTTTGGTAQYGNGNPSAVDKAFGNKQIRQEHFDRKAILEIKDEMYFSKLSGFMGIPKNTGKEIVKHRWLPILDDANVSNPISTDVALGVEAGTGNIYGSSRGMGFIRSKYPTIEENTARGNAISVTRKEVRSGIANYGLMHEWTKDEYNFDSDPKLKMHTTREILRATNQINEDMLADELINGAGIVYSAGTDALNVDSSVKYVKGDTYDAGDIVYTGTADVSARYYKVLKDLDPASDKTEEEVAAIDENSSDDEFGYIIDDAGLASVDAFSGINFTAVPSIEDLYRIDAELDHNKCPVDTKIIDGSLKTDTKTVQNARYMFISPDMKMAFMQIKKLNGIEDAFIPVEQYAAANTNKKYIQSINGEIGQVGPFRIVVHPKMVKYSDTNDKDVGTAVGGAKNIYINNNTKELTDEDKSGDDEYSYYCRNTDYVSDGTNYAVYPCVVVGSGSYTNLGFEGMAGTAQKFKVKHKMPEELITRENAFGKFGLTTVEWWSGVLIERPEWIAVYNCVAKY